MNNIDNSHHTWYPQSPKPKSPQGWICPACGCGNAPWASKCGHCKPQSTTGTSSTR